MSSKTSIAERAGFTFYRSFRDAIDRIAPEEQLSLYKAIANYALDGTLPDVDSMGSSSSLCWMMIQPILQSGLTKYLNGKLGGAPKGNTNALKNKLKSTKKQATNKLQTSNINENENENEKKEKYSKEKSAVSPRRTHALVADNPPTAEEVIAYFVANGQNAETGRRAYEYYAAGGWRDSNGKPVRNWQQKVRAVWFGTDSKAAASTPSLVPPAYKVISSRTPLE